jgi:hypothetical protein
MGDEDENDMEDMSGYEKSGPELAGLGLEAIVSVLLPAGSGLIPAISGMVNVTRTQISPKSQFLIMISPISSDLSLACA